MNQPIRPHWATQTATSYGEFSTSVTDGATLLDDRGHVVQVIQVRGGVPVAFVDVGHGEIVDPYRLRSLAAALVAAASKLDAAIKLSGGVAPSNEGQL